MSHPESNKDTAHHAADTRAVTDLFTATATAWAEADAVAYGDCFTDDAEYVTFVGTHLRGRKQIVDSHDALWEHFQKNTRLHQEVRSLRFVTADVAVLVSVGTILQPKQAGPKRGDLKVQTLVAVRQDAGEDSAFGGWRFTAFHNTKHRRLMELFAAKRDSRIAPDAV